MLACSHHYNLALLFSENCLDVDLAKMPGKIAAVNSALGSQVKRECFHFKQTRQESFNTYIQLKPLTSVLTKHTTLQNVLPYSQKLKAKPRHQCTF